MNLDRPIGIFDSGIGGLTVAAAIKRKLPNENFVYFGDTAHLPYGDKSPATIKLYSRRICNFLLEKQCKAIVVACHTASALASTVLEKEYAQILPLINVIDPTVTLLNNKGTTYRHIGIIGTRGTINSGVYQQKLVISHSDRRVAALATPLLVPMIEEGFFDNQISKAIIHTYLNDPLLANIDSLILACTHYPLLKKEILDYLDNRVEVIDSADLVADSLHRILEASHLLAKSGGEDHRFYISDITPTFEKSAEVFFGKELHLQLIKELV